MAADSTTHSSTIRAFLIQKIVGIVIFLGVIVVGLTWFGARRTIRLFAESVIGEKLQLTTAELNGFFNPIQRELLAAAAWGRTDLLSLDAPDRVEALLVPFLSLYPWVSGATLADENGREFAIVRDGLRWKVRQMNRQEWGAEVARWSEWADDAPTKIHSEASFPGHDPRTRPWYMRAVGARMKEVLEPGPDNDQVYWTAAYMLATLKRPGITVCTAFDSPAGVEHVVAFDLLIYDIHDFTANIGIADDPTRVFVLTDDGRALGLPLTGQPLDRDEVEQRLLKDADEVDIPLVADAAKSLIPFIDKNRPIKFDSGEEAWWGEAQSFPPGDVEDQVAMIVIVPEASLLGDLKRQLLLLIGGTLVCAVLVIVYTIRMGRAISRPIQNLADESDRLSRGIIESQTPIDSRLKEVNKLGDALDKMRGSLGTLFRVEHSLRRARAEEGNSCHIDGHDIAVWSEADRSQAADQVNQAVPHQTATICDHIMLDAGKSVLLLLADATGEGLESEFLASQVRSMVRMAARLNPDVEGTAQVINDHLYSDVSQGHFVSAWLARADADGLTHYTAGLQPLFHYQAADKACAELNADTMPLGVFDDTSTITSTQLAMGSGDVLAVLSDRVFSFKDRDGRLLAPQTIADELTRTAHASADAILGAIRDRIEAFLVDHPRAFEVSIIVIKRS